MSTPTIFTPIKLGALELPNRILLAPMTRSRATKEGVQQDISATYYVQRASAGLLITEATNTSETAIGYTNTPGMYTAEQVAGWKKITEAVHAAGGRIFNQLFHTGRLAHPSFHGGTPAVAPSAIAAKGEAYTYTGMQPNTLPHALETSEVAALVNEFAQAATHAKAAGFDGIEIHGANGYIIDQFLRDGTNQRTDIYGGSVENRIRLLLEITEKIVAIWGADRVGVRFSPASGFNDMSDSNPLATFGAAIEALNRFGLAYIHVIDPVEGHVMFNPTLNHVSKMLRPLSKSPYIINGGYDKATGNAALEAGLADAVAYGVPFLANPDLPKRFELDAPLNAVDFDTFYQGGEKGYTDYPTLDATLTA